MDMGDTGRGHMHVLHKLYFDIDQDFGVSTDTINIEQDTKTTNFNK